MQGPPGTGKTKTIGAMAHLHVTLLRRKILLTTPSNGAAHLLARMVLKMGISCWRLSSYKHTQQVLEGPREDLLESMLPHAAARQLASEGYETTSKQWSKHVNKRYKFLLLQKSLYVTTCGICNSDLFSGLEFDNVIIDEAAQGSDPTILMPVILCKSDGTITQVGDHKQLPAAVRSRQNVRAGGERSMFERLAEVGGMNIETLCDQYRMQPAISKFPNAKFYKGLLKDGAREHKTPLGKCVCFRNVEGAEKEEAASKSLFNESEIEKTVSIVEGP